MAVKVGSARIDERNKISGGQAGDQTGSEVATQNWYLHSKGWNVIRAKDSAVAEKIAHAMETACKNDKIGYDQSSRNSLFNAISGLGFDPARCNVAVECDCSSLVRVCVHYAGITCKDFNTSSELSVLKSTGKFDILTDDKYCKSSDYLLRGDILVTKTKGHTVVVLSNGAKAVATPVKPEVTVTPAKNDSPYYPKYTGDPSAKLDKMLETVGAPFGNVSKRKPLAKANNISNYTGTYEQNTKLIKLVKTGTLKRV